MAVMTRGALYHRIDSMRRKYGIRGVFDPYAFVESQEIPDCSAQVYKRAASWYTRACRQALRRDSGYAPDASRAAFYINARDRAF